MWGEEVQGENTSFRLNLDYLAMAHCLATVLLGSHVIVSDVNNVYPKLTEPAAQIVTHPTPQPLDMGAAFGQLPCFGFPTVEARVF